MKAIKLLKVYICKFISNRTKVFSEDINLGLKKISYREILGPQLVFINLTMNNNERNQRLLDRHEGDEQIVKLMKVGSFSKDH